MRFAFVFPDSACAVLPPHVWLSRRVAFCSRVDFSSDFRVPSGACLLVRLSYGSLRLTGACAGASFQFRCGSFLTGDARPLLFATRENSGDWFSFIDLCALCSRDHRSAGAFQAIPGYVASRIALWTSFEFALTTANVRWYWERSRSFVGDSPPPGRGCAINALAFEGTFVGVPVTFECVLGTNDAQLMLRFTFAPCAANAFGLVAGSHYPAL